MCLSLPIILMQIYLFCQKLTGIFVLGCRYVSFCFYFSKERCITSQSLFVDARDMLKLEKIDFGGIKGASLSRQVETLFEEFNNLFKMFGDLKYDPLDPLDQVSFE